MSPEYWFARRFPIGHSRSAFAPVHWKGWAMTSVHVLALTGGGALFVWFGMNDRMVEGVALFAVIALVATCWFLLLVRANSDTVHTVADYKKGLPRV